MRRNGFTLVQSLIVVAVVVILAAILFPILGRRPDHGGGRGSCRSNLAQIALGHIQYIQDYDDYLPLVSAGDLGWSDSLLPYLKSYQIYRCPSAVRPTNQPTDQFSTDYFFNARVAGLKRSRISFAAQTILSGEGLDNGPTNSHLSELPFNWKTDDHSPAKRHLDGANYAFVDGHVKWLKPNKISTQTPKSKEFIATFAVR